MVEEAYIFKVSPTISGSVLTLSASGMMSVSIDLSRIQGKGFRVAVWGQAVAACDCGEEAARWLSRFLLQEDTGFRLVYYPLHHPTREVRKKNQSFPLTTSDTVSFSLNYRSERNTRTRLPLATSACQLTSFPRRLSIHLTGSLPRRHQLLSHKRELGDRSEHSFGRADLSGTVSPQFRCEGRRCVRRGQLGMGENR